MRTRKRPRFISLILIVMMLISVSLPMNTYAASKANAVEYIIVGDSHVAMMSRVVGGFSFNYTAGTVNKADGTVKIINASSGKAIDVAGSVVVNSRNIQQYQWNNSKAQKWIMQKNSDGTVTFLSALNKNFALDLAGGKTANGSNIHLYRVNGTSAQKWIIK